MSSDRGNEPAGVSVPETGPNARLRIAPTMTNDDALVTECLRGDEYAFRLLVDRHRSRLHTLACGILQDADAAADAVQDTFLKAYAALPDYRGRGLFGAWLRRILVNHCLSLLRQRHNYLSLDELDRELVSHERSPEEQALAQNEADAIRSAMSRLPAHHRAALVLRVVEGLSYREIAGLLSVPESTVETWIHRGRLKMRALLRPDPAPGPLRAPAGHDERAPSAPRPAHLLRKGLLP
jgi:RNA polymerase sigma-70 factor, ECF subfamily